MKPWEETWSAEPVPEYCDEAGAAYVIDADGLLVAEPTQRSDGDLAARERAAFEVARFIAAAPDIARVLLAVERSGVSADGDAACPACLADARDSTDPPSHPVDHRDDCALEAALRKAGVR